MKIVVINFFFHNKLKFLCYNYVNKKIFINLFIIKQVVVINHYFEKNAIRMNLIIFIIRSFV